MSVKSLKLKRMPLAKRMDTHETAMREQIVPMLRLMNERIELLEAEIAELKSRDDTAQRLAAMGMVQATVGRA